MDFVSFSCLQCEGLGLPFVEGDFNSGLSPSERLELWVPQGPMYGSGLMMNSGVKDTKDLVVNSSKVNRAWTDDCFTVPQITSTTAPSAGFKRSRSFWYNNH